METKPIDILKPDPKNPRIMKQHDADALLNSMNEFGDLSPVTFNVRTQQMVGGHRRTETFSRMQGDRRIVYHTQHYDQPDQVGTVATGFINIGNKQFSYREVDWPLEKQRTANIAANRIQGDFDLNLLAEINNELAQFDNGAELLALTGQDESELARLNAGPDEPKEPKDDDNRLSLKFLDYQHETVINAIMQLKRERNLQADLNDDKDAVALYQICKDYLDATSHNTSPESPPQSAV